jgi:hypothetical protein
MFVFLLRSQASGRKAAFSLGYPLVAPTGAFDYCSAGSCPNFKSVNAAPPHLQLWNRFGWIHSLTFISFIQN